MVKTAGDRRTVQLLHCGGAAAQRVVRNLPLRMPTAVRFEWIARSFPAGMFARLGC